MIERTLIAQCDDAANTCDEYVELNPFDNQPFTTLTERYGWGTQASTDAVLTFCPKHKDQAD